jgi:hypothetical protein
VKELGRDKMGWIILIAVLTAFIVWFIMTTETLTLEFNKHKWVIGSKKKHRTKDEK